MCASCCLRSVPSRAIVNEALSRPRAAEVGAREEEQALARSAPQRVVDEQGHRVDFGPRPAHGLGELAKRDHELLLTGCHVDEEYAVVIRGGHPLGPVPGAGVSGHQAQAGHSRVVDAGEVPAVERNAAIAHRRVLEPVLAYAPALRNVVEDAEDLARLGIPVVEEELVLRIARVPIQHGSLLHVPPPGGVHHADLVAVLRIKKDDLGDVVRIRHAVHEVCPQRDDVAPALVPGDGPDMADVAKEVILRSECDLLALDSDHPGRAGARLGPGPIGCSQGSGRPAAEPAARAVAAQVRRM